MNSLREIQKRVGRLIMQPLTRDDRLRKRAMPEANALIKPNSRLTSLERLEIYGRQYWFRLLSCAAEDFPGLRAILGAGKFEALMRAFLAECPSVSFSLRSLGSRLESWVLRNRKWIAPHDSFALDMIRLEWAHIEAFDSASEPQLTPAGIESAELNLRLSLQPYVRLLELEHAVDDFLIEVHDYAGDTGTSRSTARERWLRNRAHHYADPERERIYLAVHRVRDSVYYKRTQPDAYRLLEALSAQRSIDQAIDFAFENSSLPEEERINLIQHWFANWAELGWLCRPAESFWNKLTR